MVIMTFIRMIALMILIIVISLIYTEKITMIKCTSGTRTITIMIMM